MVRFGNDGGIGDLSDRGFDFGEVRCGDRWDLVGDIGGLGTDAVGGTGAGGQFAILNTQVFGARAREVEDGGVGWAIVRFKARPIVNRIVNRAVSRTVVKRERKRFMMV